MVAFVCLTPPMIGLISSEPRRVINASCFYFGASFAFGVPAVRTLVLLGRPKVVHGDRSTS